MTINNNSGTNHQSNTPWKINTEHTNHPPFRKENYLNQTSMIMFHVNLPGCIQKDNPGILNFILITQLKFTESLERSYKTTQVWVTQKNLFKLVNLQVQKTSPRIQGFFARFFLDFGPQNLLGCPGDCKCSDQW